VLENGFSFHRSEWMQSDRGPGLSPTVFLVEQPPNAVLAPHFHTQNQFQVVKAGSGTLGAHAVGPGSVHYAGAFTGYGPLVAGPAGLSYFTIRAVYETGANFLPDARDRLQRGPKRNAHGPLHEPLASEALRSLASARQVPLIAPQDPLARVRDMDSDQIVASVAFPSFPRFCGQVFTEAADKELALLCVRAYNDFMLEEWHGAAPNRHVKPSADNGSGQRIDGSIDEPSTPKLCA